MRTLRTLALLAATVVSFSVGADTSESLIVAGKIANMDEAKKYLASDSFLQVVNTGKGGRVALRSDGRGRLTYQSKLAKAEIPKSGIFSLSTSGLQPGRYVIACQKLEPFSALVVANGTATTNGLSGQNYLRKKGEHKALEINVPEDVKKPTLDLGDVCIPTPNSKC